MNFTIMLSDGVSTMAAASSTTSSTRTLSSSSSSSSQESVSATIGSIVSTATNQSTTTNTMLGNYKPPSSNQVSIGLNIIQSTTTSTTNNNNHNNNNNNHSNSTLTLSTSASSSSSSSNSALRTNQINILQNEIVPTILGHNQHHSIPSDIEQQIHSALVAASTTCNTGGIDCLSNHSSNLIENNSSIITTTHPDDLKVITMDGGSSLISSVDVNNHQCSSIDVIDDCCPSTTLTHDAILMQITDDTMIPTSPIATLSLNSNVRQSIGVNNNNKNATNNNILFNTNGTTASTTTGTDPVSISGDNYNSNEQQQMRIISGDETGSASGSSVLCNHNNFNPICSASTSSTIVATTSGNVVVSATPSSSSVSASSSSSASASASASVSYQKDNNNISKGNNRSIITTSVTGTSSNNASTATDDLNMNTDSLSSGSLQIDDTDQQLDDNEDCGYQKMLLDMEQQQTTASFMSSLNISPFSMTLEQQPSSPAHGSTSSQTATNNTNNNNVNAASGNAGGNGGNDNAGDSLNSSVDALSPPDYAYAIGNTTLHLSGNNNGTSNHHHHNPHHQQQQPQHHHHQHQQQQQHHHHQQQQPPPPQQQQQQQPQHHPQQPQQQQHQQQHQNYPNIPANCANFSYSYIYNFDSPYIFPTGYQDNASSNSQQSGGGGNVSGVGGVSSIAGGNGTTAGVIAGSSNNSYISLLPPPVGTAGATGQSGESLDFKYLFEELCPVCGDKVSGYHYGLLTCESCKGFFKRTVQNKKVYTCVAERSCHIDKTQRKRCPYCRFQKCLEVGMKLEAVRADRMRGGRNKFGPMYKRDRARKLQMMRQRQLALQAIRGSMSGGSTDLKTGQISPTGYQQTYPSMNIKQEIQIPQVSSLTQSPDSSPSPIAIALGQVNPSTAVNASSLGGNVSTGPGSTNTATVSGGTSGSGSHGHGSDTGSSTSLQHTSDSKLCFDTGTNPTSTADSVSAEPLRVSPMIREFVQSIDDREWQTQLFTLLQKQSYNQVEVDLFELMCKVLDQNLFSQVDWARNTVFFKDLKVDDQMKLLQHSWSDMLVLDHLHQRIHNNLPDETPLNNGQVFNLLGLGLLGVPQLADYFNELQNKLQELKFDMGDYVCMKFLILLNPNVRGIINKKTVLEGHENVQAALLDYTLTCYPTVTDKFSRLLSILPDIHAMAARGEEHLYLKHVAGNAPTQTLLMEMLHAKRKV